MRPCIGVALTLLRRCVWVPHPLLVNEPIVDLRVASPEISEARRQPPPYRRGREVAATTPESGRREGASPVTKVLIRVNAKLSDELTSAFPQLMVKDHPAQTTLMGDLSDQDELQGVLNLLRSLGIDIVEILTLPE